jgi:hypothetical protein
VDLPQFQELRYGLKVRISNFFNRFFWFYKTKGFRELFLHLCGKIIRPSRFEKFCSTVDIRNSKVKIALSPVDFISYLYPEIKKRSIEKFVKEAESKLSENQKISSADFPSKWNSGRNLQVIIFAISRLIPPDFVVETGTANGTTANSWASAMKLNKKGKVLTVDIRESTLPAVSKENLRFIECQVSDGSINALSKILQKRNFKNSIFLHDSDHSYFGQYSDYQAALNNNFDLLLSDDIDASLAFIDFSENLDSVVLFDERKFIGGVRLKS